jgi:O-antigen ligase
MPMIRDVRIALTALTFFTLLAGDFWRYLLSWYGWGVVVAALLAGWVVVIVRDRVDLRRIPIALGAFLVVVTASTLWAASPPTTALAALISVATVMVATAMSQTVSLADVVRALGVALRWIIGMSLAFELLVEVFVGSPVLPLWVEYEGRIPRAFYWSRSLLFEGGRIQGIPGNANLLGFAVLLAIIVFGIQLATRSVGRAAGIGWLAVAVATLLLTRSTTVLVATLGVGAALVLIVAARRLAGRGRLALAVGTSLAAIGLVAGVIAARETLLDLVGRSDDLTGRLDIWAATWGLVEQRPVAGWGWMGYWAPWVEPFDDLVVIRGVTYLQAHNAWLDVLMQLGVIGLVVFSILIITTSARVTSRAIDLHPDTTSAERALRLLPALVLTALLVQSLAESRLLTESGLLLLALLAITSRSFGADAPTRVRRP